MPLPGHSYYGLRFSAAAPADFFQDHDCFGSSATFPDSSGIGSPTNHDVKAVEYFLKSRVADDAELAAASEFTQ